MYVLCEFGSIICTLAHFTAKRVTQPNWPCLSGTHMATQNRRSRYKSDHRVCDAARLLILPTVLLSSHYIRGGFSPSKCIIWVVHTSNVQRLLLTWHCDVRPAFSVILYVQPQIQGIVDFHAKNVKYGQLSIAVDLLCLDLLARWLPQMIEQLFIFNLVHYSVNKTVSFMWSWPAEDSHLFTTFEISSY